MNVYLDVYGVLLLPTRQSALYADEFLQTVLSKYPESTYWLTTFCKWGDNRAPQVLSPVLQPQTRVLLSKVKPTNWGDNKTDAIDFSEPFLWIDDNLSETDRSVLEHYHAIDNHIGVDLSKNPDQLQDLIRQYFR